MERGFLKRCLEEGLSLRQIGERVSKDPSTVGYWVKKHGLIANGKEKYAPRGGIVAEVLELLVDESASLSEMAEELDLSTSTVRYWLRQYGLHTDSRHHRRVRLQRAQKTGSSRFQDECRRHGWTTFQVERSGTVRCLRCRSEAVANWRRRTKERLVKEAGGRCVICGYGRCVAALEFHHIDPSQKAFGLSVRGITRSIAIMREEAAKCVLLCATCHAEVEAGATPLPVKSRTGV